MKFCFCPPWYGRGTGEGHLSGWLYLDLLLPSCCGRCTICWWLKPSGQVYDHQTEGLVECFNQTLKQMLCKWANEDGKDWDRWLLYLLLAYWEVLQANCLRYCKCLWMEHVWSILCVKKVCVWYKCMWPVGNLSLSMGVPHHSHTCHRARYPTNIWAKAWGLWHKGTATTWVW